jgi:iron complex transport system ATP-binding protein
MNGETIRLKNLTIGYSSKSNTKKVSEHIDASIQSGELTCLLGVNGAGKSTLLKTLSTFLPKLAGKIFIQGKDIDLFSDKELSRIIGVVLTERNELHNLTVSELVAMGRSPYTGFWGRLRKEDKKMVEQSIALVKIEDLATRMMHTLSDGERQKVMIAKALAQETPVIYLDEPTAFLDFPSKVEIMQLLLRLTRETNKTIFLSTHDLELALQIADRIWLMSKNSGIIVGTPEELSLQGHISSFFKSDGFIFDEQTRLFRIQNPYKCTKNQSSHDLSISTLSETDYPELMLVWEASVRATHHFLKEEDILLFKKLIPEKYLDVVRLFAVRNSDNRILGFLGVSDDNIEMLFIHPDARGKGIGSVLLNYALNELHLRKVDVNEQNEKALGFYLHKGFTVKSRSEQDGTGKPYPTLHLEIISPKQKFSVRQARI